MTMHTLPTSNKLAWIPAICGILLFTQCSSDNTSDNETMRNERYVSESTTTPDPATTDAHGTQGTLAPSGTQTHTGATRQSSTAGNTVIIIPPGKERVMVTNDMRGLRSLLMADLEEVRSRLNDGARPAASREIDKALAADLAQGLERVDRALAALGTASDATWASMRDAQLKEVAEVRSWMADYRVKETWASK